jgi:Spy/CpxP family protein refolding chaperone
MKRAMIFRFIVVCSLVLNAVFVAMWMTHAAPKHFMKYCQGGSENNHHGKCPMQKGLSMSDSQWTLVKPGIASFRETHFRLCGEIAKNRAALVDELEKTPIDTAALSACKERIVACQKEMQTLAANHILEEKKMLTPDQQRRFFNTLRSNMSCGGFSGIMGTTPEGIGGRCSEHHIERRKGDVE